MDYTPLIYGAVTAFLITLFLIPILIRKLPKAGLVGKDVNKATQPSIPEMGGIAIVAGLVLGVLIAIATFQEIAPLAFTALITILMVALIGMFDDVVGISHRSKVILPLIAAIPLVLLTIQFPYITLPFIGQIYLAIAYPLLLVPIAVTAVSNLTNMLAGFNGLEAGMGIVACATLGVAGLMEGSIVSAILMFTLTAALTGFIIFNRYPARIFIGDIGTLVIGATIACAIIIGKYEFVGVVVMLPYLTDFVIKVKNGFPREIDFLSLKEGKITTSKVVGLPSLILKLTKGLKEQTLVMILINIEMICCAIAIAMLL